MSTTESCRGLKIFSISNWKNSLFFLIATVCVLLFVIFGIDNELTASRGLENRPALKVNGKTIITTSNRDTVRITITKRSVDTVLIKEDNNIIDTITSKKHGTP